MDNSIKLTCGLLGTTEVSEFEDIVIKSADGTLVKLKDVGRAELEKITVRFCDLEAMRVWDRDISNSGQQCFDVAKRKQKWQDSLRVFQG